MPQERSEVHEAAVRIDALAVPAKQSGYGKGVSKVMESGWGDARRRPVEYEVAAWVGEYGKFG